jgi:hypothetical protein
MISISHNAGFFSCCSVKLTKIVDFINSNKKLPDKVDSHNLFGLYKYNKNNDVTFDYFENYNNITNDYIKHPINYHWNYQFISYNNLDYKCVTPLIKKYFSPSVRINEIINNIENKYNIIYENTVAVYYRGTDKKKETKLSSFDEFYRQIMEIINMNKNIKILIQTDTSKFIDYINDKKLKNIFIINENKTSYNDIGIHCEQSIYTNYYDMFNFLSTVLIISKCKYIICSSGNCSIWMMFYRGNAKNTIQYCNGVWFNTIC